MVEGGKTPFLSSNELEDLGFKIVVYPLAGLFSATKAVANCFEYLKKNGTSQGIDEMLDFGEFEKVIDTAKYRQLESKFKAD